MKHLQQQYDNEQFANEYQLVNGVAMHSEHPENFQISPDVIKRHVKPNQFVELRIDSPRFSVHAEAAEKCTCPSCNGKLTKPILRHDHPASLVLLPNQNIPSRGWGEDFWVRITERCNDYFRGVVDNPLVESRLHGLNQGDEIIFHADHILAVHDVHKQELVAGMDEADLKELTQWLAAHYGSEE
ncbi:MAG: hypothetical protein R3C17_10770 [Planctomycetaceae bacterium]